MAESVTTVGGDPLDLDATRRGIDREFAAALSEPATESSAPPKRGPKSLADDSADAGKPRVSGARRGRPPGSGKKTPEPAPAGSHADRKQAIQGLVQMGAAGFVMVAQRTPEPSQTALKADGITLASNAEQLGEAVATTADQDERFARLVDRVAIAGPCTHLVIVVFAIGMQCARNHGVAIPGTTDPKELVALAEAA